MKDDFKDMYWGSNKIISSEDVERKTFNGNDVVEITIQINENKTKALEFPKVTVYNAATKDPSDANQLRETFVVPIVEKMLAIIADAEPLLEDVEYILQKISMSLNYNLETAGKILWGKDLYDRTVGDLYKVFTKNALIIKDELPTKETASGDGKDGAKSGRNKSSAPDKDEA